MQLSPAGNWSELHVPVPETTHTGKLGDASPAGGLVVTVPAPSPPRPEPLATVTPHPRESAASRGPIRITIQRDECCR